MTKEVLNQAKKGEDMGFLDNLFKKEAKKFVSGMVEKAVDTVMNGNSSGNVKLTGTAGLRARLEEVVANEYTDYEFRQNVPAREIGAESGTADYSYGLYKNGAPVAFFNVIENKNDYKKKPLRMAKQAAEMNNIPHMNFFSHLPNETSYISQRLKKEIIRY